MEYFFFDSRHESPEKIFKIFSLDARSFKVAVAYVTKSGLDLLSQIIDDKAAQLICGVDGCISDISAVNQWTREHNVLAKVFIGENKFHVKLYLIEKISEITAIVGSFNLTRDGLSQNEEIFFGLKSTADDPIIKNVIEYFNNLWSSDLTIDVDEFLKKNPNYKQQHRIIVKRQIKNEKVSRKIQQKIYQEKIEEKEKNISQFQLGNLKNKSIGTITAKNFKGRNISAAHLGNRNCRFRDGEGSWRGDLRNRITPEEIEKLFEIKIRLKGDGSIEEGYPTKSSAEVAWNELVKMFNRGVKDVSFSPQIPAELQNK